VALGFLTSTHKDGRHWTHLANNKAGLFVESNNSLTLKMDSFDTSLVSQDLYRNAYYKLKKRNNILEEQLCDLDNSTVMLKKQAKHWLNDLDRTIAKDARSVFQEMRCCFEQTKQMVEAFQELKQSANGCNNQILQLTNLKSKLHEEWKMTSTTKENHLCSRHELAENENVCKKLEEKLAALEKQLKENPRYQTIMRQMRSLQRTLKNECEEKQSIIQAKETMCKQLKTAQERYKEEKYEQQRLREKLKKEKKINSDNLEVIKGHQCDLEKKRDRIKLLHQEVKRKDNIIVERENERRLHNKNQETKEREFLALKRSVSIYEHQVLTLRREAEMLKKKVEMLERKNADALSEKVRKIQEQISAQEENNNYQQLKIVGLQRTISALRIRLSEETTRNKELSEKVEKETQNATHANAAAIVAASKLAFLRVTEQVGANVPAGCENDENEPYRDPMDHHHTFREGVGVQIAML
jgi:hypothetical protein